jgi:glutathione S-transferase
MKLYYSSGSCSLASHIVLEEAGATFEAVRLNLREGEQKKPEYLKINPKAKVPSLVLDDGQVLTENPAIMSYVADTHPAAELLPPVGELARARAQEWLAWCASAIHAATFGPMFAAGRIADAAEKQATLERLKATLAQQMEMFDGGLEGKSFVLGEFSIADAYTLVFANWMRLFGLTPGDNIKRSVKALLARPGVQRAVTTQQLKIEV